MQRLMNDSNLGAAQLTPKQFDRLAEKYGTTTLEYYESVGRWTGGEETIETSIVVLQVTCPGFYVTQAVDYYQGQVFHTVTDVWLSPPMPLA